MLKINNADRFIKDKVSEYGEAIVLLGMRKSESISRHQTMNLYKIENSLLSKHSKFAQTYVYTPLEDFTAEDVWNYLLQNKNPWGEENRDLLALYQDANASECPLVVDTSTPSCGGGRFGCWTCTVVENQNYLTNMADKGEKWLEVLDVLRNKLKDTQNAEMWEEVREKKRRSGRIQLKSNKSICKDEKCGKLNDAGKTICDDCGGPLTTYTPGPYKMDFRKKFLRELLEGQKKVQEMKGDPNLELILEEEIHEIQRIWRMEQGDWQNSAYEIYNDVMGEHLAIEKEDIGGFGGTEQKLLMQVCQKRNVPYQLVSTLLNLEFEYQGASKHSKINDKIKSELNKEWRDYEDPEKLKEILGELAKDKEILDSVKPGEKKDTKETLLEKIEKEKNGENRPDVIKNFQNKIAKLEEEDDV